jgi:hypothetical protein
MSIRLTAVRRPCNGSSKSVAVIAIIDGQMPCMNRVDLFRGTRAARL